MIVYTLFTWSSSIKYDDRSLSPVTGRNITRFVRSSDKSTALKSSNEKAPPVKFENYIENSVLFKDHQCVAFREILWKSLVRNVVIRSTRYFVRHFKTTILPILCARNRWQHDTYFTLVNGRNTCIYQKKVFAYTHSFFVVFQGRSARFCSPARRLCVPRVHVDLACGTKFVKNTTGD